MRTDSQPTNGTSPVAAAYLHGVRVIEPAVWACSVYGKPGARGRGTYGAEEGYTRVSTHARWIMGQMAGK